MNSHFSMKQNSMRTGFIELVKRLILLIIAIAAAGIDAQAEIVTKPVVYQSEGFQLEGYLAYNDAVTEKRHGVLVVHECRGLNDSIRNGAGRRCTNWSSKEPT